MDWAGAEVYEFEKSHLGKVRILAYSLKDAVASLELLEKSADEEWERQNADRESIQETFA
jgi:hypothetical protein